jgi:hypothetical protein
MAASPDGDTENAFLREDSGSLVYFDGTSNRRRAASIACKDHLEISSDGAICARWPYADIRKADSPSGTLRVSCLSAPARLEIRDSALAAGLASRCGELDKDLVDGAASLKLSAGRWLRPLQLQPWFSSAFPLRPIGLRR